MRVYCWLLSKPSEEGVYSRLSLGREEEVASFPLVFGLGVATKRLRLVGVVMSLKQFSLEFFMQGVNMMTIGLWSQWTCNLGVGGGGVVILGS